MKRVRSTIAILTAVTVSFACEAGTGPGEGTDLTLSFTGRGASAPALSLSGGGLAADPITQTDDNANELVIERVQLVLDEIELEGDDDACEAASEGEEDEDCAEFEAGPFLVDLPLDEVERAIAVNVPTGVYTELEFEIHKVDDDDDDDEEDARDAAFLMEYPDFRGISIRVDGTFNGEAFVYTTDLNVEQELDLDPPLVVEDGTTTTNVTVSAILTGWFRDDDGNLVDPDTANEGGPNESLVKENIKDSFEAFEDEDEDGEDDD